MIDIEKHEKQLFSQLNYNILYVVNLYVTAKSTKLHKIPLNQFNKQLRRATVCKIFQRLFRTVYFANKAFIGLQLSTIRIKHKEHITGVIILNPNFEHH